MRHILWAAMLVATTSAWAAKPSSAQRLIEVTDLHRVPQIFVGAALCTMTTNNAKALGHEPRPMSQAACIALGELAIEQVDLRTVTMLIEENLNSALTPGQLKGAVKFWESDVGLAISQFPRDYPPESDPAIASAAWERAFSDKQRQIIERQSGPGGAVVAANGPHVMAGVAEVGGALFATQVLPNLLARCETDAAFEAKLIDAGGPTAAMLRAHATAIESERAAHEAIEPTEAAAP